MAKTHETVNIEGRELNLSNPDKVFYPATHFTKAQMIDYYVRISPYLLPHLKNRPATLKRYPDGVRGEFFYEKDAPSFTPKWVECFLVSRRGRGGKIHYVLINDLATLVWVANIASIELHPFLHRAPNIDRPLSIVFDCDSGPGADVLTCARVAILLRDLLAKLGLKSFAKASGSKGLQVYVPLNTNTTYELTGAFAKAIAQLMEQREPKLVVSKMAKDLRANKVFIDWSQNSDFKTTVSVYSLRAKGDKPFASVPVTWNELSSALRRQEPESLFFDPEQTIKRADRLGDLFSDVLTLKQRLPKEVIKSMEAGSSVAPPQLTKRPPPRQQQSTSDAVTASRPKTAQPRRAAREGRSKRQTL